MDTALDDTPFRFAEIVPELAPKFEPLTSNVPPEVGRLNGLMLEMTGGA
jgi:hypothetical protein